MSANVPVPEHSVKQREAVSAGEDAKVVYPPNRPYPVACGVCGFRWKSRGKGLFYKCPHCYRAASAGSQLRQREATHGR
jgi:tRNA(Ile2) C34 agmatinyltransferase TiaS